MSVAVCKCSKLGGVHAKHSRHSTTGKVDYIGCRDVLDVLVFHLSEV